MYSIYVDWSKAIEDSYNSSEPSWEFISHDLLSQDRLCPECGEVIQENDEGLYKCGDCGKEYTENETTEQLDDNPDIGYPMMNFAYPIYHFDGDEDKIRQVNEETNCTIVYNADEDRYYLALTGGGMDLSQDIAKAYMLVQGYIEWDLVEHVHRHGPLSVGKDWFIKILKELERQTDIISQRATRDLQEIKTKLKEYE